MENNKNNKRSRRDYTQDPKTVLCQCGCGSLIPKFNKLGKLARFRHGHNQKKTIDYSAFSRNEKIRQSKLGKPRPDMIGNQFRKGIKPVNPILIGARISPSTEFKKGFEPWNKDKPHLAKEKNPNWKGGIVPEQNALRQTHQYRNWRKKVYERDNYTCRHCSKRGVRLEPHHIKSFQWYPELRFKVSNGLTLCYDCHQKTKKPLVKT